MYFFNLSFNIFIMKKNALGLLLFMVLCLSHQLSANLLPPGEDPTPKQCIEVTYKLHTIWLKCGESSGGPEGGTVKFGTGCSEGTMDFCESTITGICYRSVSRTPTAPE
jgi:hypothetical protein